MSGKERTEEVEEVVIRAMVRREYGETGGEARPPIFETVTTGASIIIGVSESVRQTILGFAEVPPRSHIGRHHEFDAFRDAIETNAHYVHWKPTVDPPTR